MQAFLFDLDGVIVDTAIYHYEAWKRLANEKLGTDFSHEFNETLKGISRMESLERIAAHRGIVLDEATKNEYATLKNDWYLELVATMPADAALPGVRQFLDQTREAGIKIGLGSVSKNARLILERLDMIHYFDAIIDGTKISNSKPHPEVFLKGAEELGINTTECLVFEDAIAGIEAAHRAGMLAVGVGDVTVLTEADLVIETFEGLTTSAIGSRLTAFGNSF